MSTTPSVETEITAATSWLKTHERIVCLFLILLVAGYGMNKYFDVSAAKAEARVVAAQQQVADAKANTATVTTQAAQTAAQYQSMVTALTQQNAALAQAVASRNTVLAQDTTKNATAPLPDLLSRWNVLAGTNVTVKGADAIVSDTDSRRTVNLLEQVPVLQANLIDETTIVANKQAELEKSDLLANSLNNEIAAQKNQLTVEANSCKLEIAAAKADSRKGKVKWFKIGFVTGFVTGLWGAHSGL